MSEQEIAEADEIKNINFILEFEDHLTGNGEKVEIVLKE